MGVVWNCRAPDLKRRPGDEARSPSQHGGAPRSAAGRDRRSSSPSNRVIGPESAPLTIAELRILMKSVAWLICSKRPMVSGPNRVGNSTPTMRAHCYGLLRTTMGTALGDGKIKPRAVLDLRRRAAARAARLWVKSTATRFCAGQRGEWNLEG